VDVGDVRRVQARLACVGRDEQAAVSLAIVEALGPLAELGDQSLTPADAGRLLAGARSASPEVLRQVLAEAEALPVMAASEEPPGRAVFAVDVLACLIYAIKTMTEPEPAVWSGYCLQRAYDCLVFADEVLGRPGRAAGLIRALDAWLDGDGGERLGQESAILAVLAGGVAPGHLAVASRRAGAVVRGFVPFDVAAGGAGCGDGDAVVDGDLVGVGLDGDLGGLACVRQANLARTVMDAGGCGGPAVAARAPRSRARSCPGTGQARLRCRSGASRGRPGCRPVLYRPAPRAAVRRAACTRVNMR
jgi:hypothetical protein